MRAMLLVALCFSCIGIYDMFSKWSQLSWLSPSPDSGVPVEKAWLASILQSIFTFAVPALIYANVFPAERFGFFRLNRPAGGMKILFGVLTMILFLPVINQGATWLDNAITNVDLRQFEDELTKINNWLFQMPTFGSFLFCLFANALVPAVCEELFFRAGIQQILTEHARIKHIPIFATALIFTFFHANPVALPYIFVAGLILGYTFYWTGSLRITIIMHFAFNGTSVLIDYLNQHNTAVQNYQPGIPLFVICLLGAGVFFFMLWKKARQRV
jgi:membrane protease YdiL (CAAX protease family)